MQSPFGRLPAELYLALLDCLNAPDASGRSSCAIYNLASCSHVMYELVERWASFVMTDKIAKTSHFKKSARFPLETAHPQADMNALCHRLAGLCDFCGVLKKFWNSPDEQLQACEVCYVALVPAIRRERLESIYDLSDPADYYGLFQLSARSSNDFRYWSYRFWSLQLKAQCCDSLVGQRFSELRPVRLEMMLRVDNFQDVAQYAAIAGVWFRRSRHDWESRPWRICNLPAFPGCLITNPSLSANARSVSISHLQGYVDRCQQIRRVMEIFPDILYDPISWQDCLRVQIGYDALSAARDAQRLWSLFPAMQDQDLTDTELILEKEVRDHEVFGQTLSGINEYMLDLVKADGTVYALF